MTRIEIHINKQRADIIDNDIHLRINRELWNPEKTVTKQLEWSYSFDLPATPTNNKIFAHANVLSVNNKYHQRYKAEVYADSTLIYDGTLIVNEYNGKEQKYNCNLVNVKINTLDEIFGEEMMTQGEWYVPFSGVPTINSVNADMTTKYFFPMVCYGAFQKWPIESDEVGKTFTPKHTIDGSNKFWVESFYPSLNVLETMRKLFENKGYTVAGSAFLDDAMSNIYASCNLANEQSPILNVGNQLFGDVDITATFNNAGKVSNGYVQELQYKYDKVAKPDAFKYGANGLVNAQSNNPADYDFNFENIIWWSALQTGNSTISLGHKDYIYDPGEHLIVAPADGWYTVQLECNLQLNTTTPFSATMHTTDFINKETIERSLNITPNLSGNTPIEVQLVKNYDQNIELIKGKWNRHFWNGNPNDLQYTAPHNIRANNENQWQTCYPHEALNIALNPTSERNLITTVVGQQFTTNTLLAVGIPMSRIHASEGSYVYGNGETMAYDPAVSEAFICGFSSLGKGVVAVQKDGRSWSRYSIKENEVIANVHGYREIRQNGQEVPTSVNYNTYNTAGNTNYCTISGNRMIGNVQCCVYLKKNDMLEVAVIERAYDGTQKYNVSGTVHVHLRAIADTTKQVLQSDPTFNMYSQSRFPTELNLFNFANKETKKVDWINSIAKAYNLEISAFGNSIDIDINKGVKKDFMTYAVNIDDRASSYDAISSRIDYPRTMAVKYKVNTNEIGFENSVPPEYINTNEWDKHGESGYSIVQLSDDSYVTTEVSTQTDFSYTWYDTFKWYSTSLPKTASGWTTLDYNKNISMPILAESRYFIESPSDEEGQKHDGYGLTQRFWFRQEPDTANVRTADNNQETVFLSLPTNTYYGLNLNYKDTEKSILTENFNFRPLLDSNYVTIEVRLTAEEYRALTSGAKVVFNDDVYYVAEIEGYDPTGENETTLKLVKKTD